MKRLLCLTVCALFLALPLSSCYTLQHEVGNGGSGGSQVEKVQWYALWGLLPIGGEVDGGELAGGAQDYTIKSEMNVLDVVINFFTSFVTIYRQTVTVTR